MNETRSLQELRRKNVNNASYLHIINRPNIVNVGHINGAVFYVYEKSVIDTQMEKADDLNYLEYMITYYQFPKVWLERLGYKEERRVLRYGLLCDVLKYYKKGEYHKLFIQYGLPMVEVVEYEGEKYIGCNIDYVLGELERVKNIVDAFEESQFVSTKELIQFQSKLTAHPARIKNGQVCLFVDADNWLDAAKYAALSYLIAGARGVVVPEINGARLCKCCGKEIERKNSSALYCSERCKQTAAKRRQRKKKRECESLITKL